MSAQDVILGARAAHVRELKVEIEKLKAENAVLRDGVMSLKAHFDLALLAAEDLRGLPEGTRIEIWDGWNLILGACKEARDRNGLIAKAEAKVAEDPTLGKVWIVFDGHDERVVRADKCVRVSYTGGTGAHRADKFICDYIRMACYLGLADRVKVRTNDRDFAKAVAKLPLAICSRNVISFNP